MNCFRIPPEDVLRNLYKVAIAESFFMFNNKVYKQIDSVTMTSPLGPALPKFFVDNLKNKCLKDCPHGLNGLNPLFYKQYVDDIIVLFYSFNHAKES